MQNLIDAFPFDFVWNDAQIRNCSLWSVINTSFINIDYFYNKAVVNCIINFF